eukprot:gene26269-33139_t
MGVAVSGGEPFGPTGPECLWTEGEGDVAAAAARLVANASFACAPTDGG